MPISRSRRLTFVLSGTALIAVLLVASRGRAEDPAAAPSKPSDAAKPAAADDVRQWAKDLDSDIFATRQEAGRKLFEAGKEAVAPLAEAASGKSLEVTNAAVDILRRLSQSSEPSIRDTAKASLEKLAKGTNATAAGLAKEALAPPQSPNAPPIGPGNIQFGNGGFGNGGGIRIQGGIGGNIQIVPGGGGAIQVFRIQANANGGNRSIDVDDNGKKVHIQEDQNGIEVRVTEKVNGQDKTDTFKAKDAAELKQKFPDAHKLYEKYGQNGVGNIQIQAQAIGVPNFAPGLVPGVPLVPNVAPAPAAANAGDKEAADQINEAHKLISEATDSLKKNAPQGNDSVRKAIEKLDAARKKLDEAHQKLGG